MPETSRGRRSRTLPDPHEYTPQDYEEIHMFADTDATTMSIHHTLGPLPTQASHGSHNHERIVNWQTLPLLNGWSAYGPQTIPKYRRVVGGMVMLGGLIRNDAVRPNYDLVANIRENYRPKYPVFWSTVYNEDAAMTMEVDPNGDIKINRPYNAPPGWISLHLIYSWM